MKRVRALMVGLAMGVAMQVCAADALTEALQKGLFEEEANQNLEAAIKAYQDVLGRAEEQRRIAATALFRLAECYRKQGKTNEASAEYRRLVRDYSEQATLVNLSRQNLVGLGVTGTVASATPTQNTDPLTTDEEQQEIQRIRGLIKNSPDLINNRNQTPTGSLLHLAAAKGQLLVAEYLIANGADIHALDYSRTTPLYHAAQYGHKRMVELLLSKGAQPSPADEAQPLHIAVERGFKGVVEVLIAHKANVNANQPADARAGHAPFPNAGMTALHVAIKEKNVQIAELLLANGANVNAVSSTLWTQEGGALYRLERLDGTPLHFAVQAGNPTLVRMLVAKGAEANVRTTHAGLVPLHYASNPRLLPDVAKSLAEMLLEAGAKIDATGTEGTQLPGWTPLHIAVYHKLPQLAQLLLEKGADPNLALPTQSGNERTALNMAVSAGTTEIAELLLKHKADVNARDHSGNTPLLRAMNQQIAELLLAHKADVAAINTEGNTALAVAVYADNLSMAELLLSKGANPNDTNAYGFPMLHVALGARPPGGLPGQPVPLRSISAPQPSVFTPRGSPQPTRIGGLSPGTSPAERKSDKTMLQLLIEYKADPNQRDQVREKESETALHVAARAGNQSAVEFLLKHKADVNARTDSGTTPLHLVVHREPIVDLLLAHNADATAAKNDGDTALNFAAAQGMTNVVAKLVHKGADINACGKDGETPLHRTLRASYSSDSQRSATIELLLKLGADILKSCGGRLTPLEVVMLYQSPPRPELVDLLRKHHPKKLAVITVEGPVAKPVWFWESTNAVTLSEAIEAVGLKEMADPTRITLQRGTPRTGWVPLGQYDLNAIRKGNVKDVALRHGDRITVGEKLE